MLRRRFEEIRMEYRGAVHHVIGEAIGTSGAV
jgi:hypothetical protein